MSAAILQAEPHAKRMLLKLADLDHLDLVVDDHAEALRWARDLAEDAVVNAESHAEAISELEQSVEYWKDEAKDLTAKVDELSTENSKLVTENSKLVTERDALREKLSETERQLAVAIEGA